MTVPLLQPRPALAGFLALAAWVLAPSLRAGAQMPEPPAVYVTTWHGEMIVDVSVLDPSDGSVRATHRLAQGAGAGRVTLGDSFYGFQSPDSLRFDHLSQWQAWKRSTLDPAISRARRWSKRRWQDWFLPRHDALVRIRPDGAAEQVVDVGGLSSPRLAAASQAGVLFATGSPQYGTGAATPTDELYQVDPSTRTRGFVVRLETPAFPVVQGFTSDRHFVHARFVSRALAVSPDARWVLALASYHVDTLATTAALKHGSVGTMPDSALSALPTPSLLALLVDVERRAIVAEHRLSTTPDQNASAVYVQSESAERFLLESHSSIGFNLSHHLLSLDLGTHDVDTVFTSVGQGAGFHGPVSTEDNGGALVFERGQDAAGRSQSEVVFLDADCDERWRAAYPFPSSAVSVSSGVLYDLDKEDISYDRYPSHHGPRPHVAATLRRSHISPDGLAESASTPLRLDFPTQVLSVLTPSR